MTWKFFFYFYLMLVFWKGLNLVSNNTVGIKNRWWLPIFLQKGASSGISKISDLYCLSIILFFCMFFLQSFNSYRLRRLDYCNWLLNMISDDSHFQSQILRPDEGTFRRDGTINRHYRSQNNPRCMEQVQYQTRQSVNIWSVILVD